MDLLKPARSAYIMASVARCGMHGQEVAPHLRRTISKNSGSRKRISLTRRRDFLHRITSFIRCYSLDAPGKIIPSRIEEPTNAGDSLFPGEGPKRLLGPFYFAPPRLEEQRNLRGNVEVPWEKREEKPMKLTTTYFEGMGQAFTQATLAIAAARAAALNIQDIVLASYTGYTMQRAMQAFSGQPVRLIAVGGTQEQFPADLRQRAEEQGHVILFHQEVGKSFPEAVANAYRRLSEGVKVCVQIVADAVDTGLVAEGTPVIAIAGTGPSGFPEGGGADTALVMSALATERYGTEEGQLPKSERRTLHEILCKPL